MNEIKWNKSTIELFQEKSREFIQLYITDNVNWPLVDYLMKVCPTNSEYGNVTKDYVRIDSPRLRLVALKVPSHV
jgi:hypothetical protein